MARVSPLLRKKMLFVSVLSVITLALVAFVVVVLGLYVIAPVVGAVSFLVVTSYAFLSDSS